MEIRYGPVVNQLPLRGGCFMNWSLSHIPALWLQTMRYLYSCVLYWLSLFFSLVIDPWVWLQQSLSTLTLTFGLDHCRSYPVHCSKFSSILGQLDVSTTTADKNVSRHCQISLEVRIEWNHLWVRTTELQPTSISHFWDLWSLLCHFHHWLLSPAKVKTSVCKVWDEVLPQFISGFPVTV